MGRPRERRDLAGRAAVATPWMRRDHDHHHDLIEHDNGPDMDQHDDRAPDHDIDHLVRDLLDLHSRDYDRWRDRINAAPDDVRAAYWRRAIAGHWC